MKMMGSYQARPGGPKLCLLLCVLTVPGLAGRALAAAEAGKGEVFKLREVSVFEQGEQSFLRGQSAVCQDKPFAEVKSYPDFVSEKPVYGSVRFAADYGQTNAGLAFYFAMDESKGTGKGYDRLYFDLNRDLDLRNDPAVMPQRHPPNGAELRYNNIKQQVIFDLLTIPFDFGPAGARLVQIMPRLTISAYEKEEYQQVTFVRTRLYEGDIKLGGEAYKAQLGNDYLIRGRLDLSGTALLLSSKDKNRRMSWWGGDRLMAAHRVRGRFYTLSATPTGEQLTVSPYRGDLGTFEIGPGERTLTNLSVTGSLEAKELAVPVGGEFGESASAKPERRCQLPVGDFRPNYISVEFGRLRIAISENYHSDGKPRDRGGRANVYGFTIRKDQPYVLDFSNKPDVMFASPAQDKPFKPGDEVEVKAVLVDPKLDFMIRGLDDTSRKQTKSADGQPLGYERNVSLDPKVLITRANGEKVAEGVMPFG